MGLVKGTCLGHIGHRRFRAGRKIARSPVDVAEATRLYGLRVWVEQSYKQVK